MDLVCEACRSWGAALERIWRWGVRSGGVLRPVQSTWTRMVRLGGLELAIWRPGCEAGLGRDGGGPGLLAWPDLGEKLLLIWHLHINRCEDLGADEIAKEIRNVKRQNNITHGLLYVMIILTAIWQLSSY
ncbi:hypothetical protein Taro_047006 [Colocasia esculenta]|uniref:Uncharacterized protein n=1 Tax=Colocasia esculenta TaxID=4460 RepID=A0A843X388_COLES|nr:hypothetical protein [Colocasia esculenta]